MNYFGSSRKLIDNSKAALIGAIEIYNKPTFKYRDEVFVILLMNAWELLLKAILSKNRRSIYYRKKRNEPYRTLSWSHALGRTLAEEVWPKTIDARPIEVNLQHLTIYRDAAVHFYNAPHFGVVVYSLAQTSIMNYRDVLGEVFQHNLADEIGWQLLPIAVDPPFDPVTYLRGPRPDHASTAVDEFLVSLSDAAGELETAGVDTGRLMTLYSVGLQSTKKIEQADVVVGVQASAGSGEPVFIERRIDPRRSHPLFMKDVLAKVEDVDLDGRHFNQYDFQAIVHHYGLRSRPEYCYEDVDRAYVRWSGQLLNFIRRLDASSVQVARDSYASYRREKRQSAT